MIQLSRRFGETAAILAGFASTKTERLMILPAFEQVETASLGRVLDALADADLVTVRRYPALRLGLAARPELRLRGALEGRRQLADSAIPAAPSTR